VPHADLLILLHLIILMKYWEEHKLWSSLLSNFLHSPVTSSVLGPTILLSILFSDILNLCNTHTDTHTHTHTPNVTQTPTQNKR
jgi:putative effector of murein hydrolase LrgA (UPF0299 family)